MIIRVFKKRLIRVPIIMNM